MANLPLPISPYEADEDLDIANTRLKLLDPDSAIDPVTGRRMRFAAFNAPEAYNPVKKSPREVGAREATERAAEFFQNNQFDNNVVGRDTTGSRDVILNRELAVDQVANQFSAPAVNYTNIDPETKRQVLDASLRAFQQNSFNPDNPDTQRLEALPDGFDFARALPTPRGRAPSTEVVINRALKRGVDQLQGNLFAGGHALARTTDELLGTDSVDTKRILKEGIDRNAEEAALNPAQFQSFDEVKNLGDLGTYALENTLSSGLSSLPMLAGGAAGVGAKTVLGAMAGAVTKKVAGAVGATLANTVTQAGEVEQGELGQVNQASGAAVLSTGLLRSGLDVLSTAVGLDKILGATAAKGVKDAAGQILKAVGVSSIAEGTTEAGQEALSIALRAHQDPNFDPFSEESVARVKEAAIAGGIVGGTLSGAGTTGSVALKTYGAQPTPDPEETPAPGPDTPPDLSTATDADLEAVAGSADPLSASAITELERRAEAAMGDTEAEATAQQEQARREQEQEQIVGQGGEGDIPPDFQEVLDQESPTIHGEAPTEEAPEFPDFDTTNEQDIDEPVIDGETPANPNEPKPADQEAGGDSGVAEPSINEGGLEDTGSKPEVIPAGIEPTPDQGSKGGPKGESKGDSIDQTIASLRKQPKVEVAKRFADADVETLRSMYDELGSKGPEQPLRARFRKAIEKELATRESEELTGSGRTSESTTFREDAGSLISTAEAIDAVTKLDGAPIKSLIGRRLASRSINEGNIKKELENLTKTLATAQSQARGKELKSKIDTESEVKSTAKQKAKASRAENASVTVAKDEKAKSGEVGAGDLKAVAKASPRDKTSPNDEPEADVKARDLAANAPAGGTGRDFTDVELGNNASAIDPNTVNEHQVTYYGVGGANGPKSSAAIDGVKGWVKQSTAILPALKRVSGLPTVVKVSDSLYLAAEDGDTETDVREKDAFFELRLEGDTWRIVEKAVMGDGSIDGLSDRAVGQRITEAIRSTQSKGDDSTATEAAARLDVTTPEGVGQQIDAVGLTLMGARSQRHEYGTTMDAHEALTYFLDGLASVLDRGYTMGDLSDSLIIYKQGDVSITYGEALYAPMSRNTLTFDPNGDAAYKDDFRTKIDYDTSLEFEDSTYLDPDSTPLTPKEEVGQADAIRKREPKYAKSVAPSEGVSLAPVNDFFSDSKIPKLLHGLAKALGLRTKFGVVSLKQRERYLRLLRDQFSYVGREMEHLKESEGYIKALVVGMKNSKDVASFIKSYEETPAFARAKHIAGYRFLKKPKSQKEGVKALEKLLGQVEHQRSSKRSDLGVLRRQYGIIRNADGSQIVYNDGYSDPLHRTPVILVDDNKPVAQQIAEASHEFGHLVKRAMVDQLIEQATTDADAKAVVKAIFGDINWDNPAQALVADERFANMMKKWTLTHKVPKTLVEKFFSGLGKQLRKVYDTAKRAFTRGSKETGRYESFEKFMGAMLYEGDGPRLSVKGTSKTYHDFVEGLTHQEFLVQNTKGPAMHHFTTPAQVAAQAKRFKDWSGDKPILGTTGKTLHATGKFFGGIGKYVVATGVSMRDLGSSALTIAAQNWHINPGEVAPKTMKRFKWKYVTRYTKEGKAFQKGVESFDTVDFMTIPEELQSLMADIEPELKAVLEKLPQTKGLEFLSGDKRKAAEAKNKAISKELQMYTTARVDTKLSNEVRAAKFKALRDGLSPEAEAVIRYNEVLYEMFSGGGSNVYGLKLSKRKQYAALVIDKEQFSVHSDAIIDIFMRTEKMSAAEANEAWTKISQSTGVMDPDIADIDANASGIRARYQRKLSATTQRELIELGVYSHDLHSILAQATHQMAKRAVEQSRFGGYVRGLDGKFKYETDAEGNAVRDARGNKKKIFNPMYRLNKLLHQASALGAMKASNGVSAKDMARVTTKYLPALRGTLGSDISKEWNAITSWTMTGLNIALLPLSVLSSAPDPAGIAMMSQVYKNPMRALGDMGKVAKLFTDKGFRSQLESIAKTLGIVSDRSVDHVLSDSTALDQMIPSTKKINEAFFEVIQMKRFTDFTRIMATGFAVDSLQSYARRLKKGDRSALKNLQDLSLSEADLMEWYNTGGTADTVLAHPAIRVAVSRWVDFSIMRPNASNRPPVGSDARYRLFWHLKSFMYEFYYTTMKRAYVQMGDHPGFGKALPGLALAAFIMPLAMAGYELRKLLTEDVAGALVGRNSRSRELEDEAYLKEMVLRGGLLGPFTVLHDMWDADKHGSLAITALGGPAFSKLVEFGDKDFVDFLVKTSPGLAQSRVLRDRFKEAVE